MLMGEGDACAYDTSLQGSTPVIENHTKAEKTDV